MAHHIDLRRLRITALALATLAAVVLSCGGSDKDTGPTGAPEKPFDIQHLAGFEFTGGPVLERLATAELFDSALTPAVVRPGDLDSSAIDAAQLLTHQFVGKGEIRAYVGGRELHLAVTQFVEPQFAYGFYSSRRPQGAELFGVGIEGYKIGNAIALANSDLCVEVVWDSLTASERDSLAAVLSREFGGRSKLPQYFVLFPMSHQIRASARYIPYQYLSVPRLGDVYAISYEMAGDTALLFLTPDSAGAKYVELNRFAETIGTSVARPTAFGYDENYALAFELPGRGVVVAGLVKGKLVGVIGYQPDSYRKLLADWVRGLSM